MNIRALLIAATAITAVAGSAFAETQTAPVKANIVTPLTVARVGVTELNFGTLSRTGTPAVSVTVDDTGAISGTTVGVTTSGTTDAAEFLVTGQTGLVVTVASSITGTLGSNITVTPNHGANTRTLDANGESTIAVGGQLTIASGAVVTAGAKSGTLQVTINYQ